MITFMWPWVVLALPLPWLLRWLLPPTRGTATPTLKVPFLSQVAQVADEAPKAQPKRPLRLILASLLWLLLVLAAMRPQWYGDPVTLPTTGRDLMLAVDVSESMGIKDLRQDNRRVSRLSVVKSVLNDFIKRRDTDRLGLVLFGSRAYLQTPLTFDQQTVRELLNEARITIAGPKTAIGDAIGLALKRLKGSPSDSRVLVLLTDGRNTAGEVAPLKAAELAAQQDLKIYTIGVGAEEMRVPAILGEFRRINPSRHLDESTLKTIAEMTGGTYFRARNSQELESIYDKLNDLEPIRLDDATYRPQAALYHWPLGLAFVITLIWAAVACLRTRWQHSPPTPDQAPTS